MLYILPVIAAAAAMTLLWILTEKKMPQPELRAMLIDGVGQLPFINGRQALYGIQSIGAGADIDTKLISGVFYLEKDGCAYKIYGVTDALIRRGTMCFPVTPTPTALETGDVIVYEGGDLFTYRCASAAF